MNILKKIIINILSWFYINPTKKKLIKIILEQKLLFDNNELVYKYKLYYNFIKKYNLNLDLCNIVPFGEDEYVVNILNDIDYIDNNDNFPFDYIKLNLDTTINIVESDFSNFLKHITFDLKEKKWKNNFYNFLFENENNIYDINILNIKYKNKISNFYKIFNDKKPLFLIRKIEEKNINKESINKLCKKIKELRQDKPFYILFFIKSDQILKNIDCDNVYYYNYNCKFTYNNKYYLDKSLCMNKRFLIFIFNTINNKLNHKYEK